MITAQRLILFLGTALLFAAQAFADYTPASQVSIRTERYHPGDITLSAGTYLYDISWQGIPVATARIFVEKANRANEPVDHVVADCWSARGIRWLYSLRHRSESHFFSRTFTPIRLSTIQTENARENASVVDFSSDGQVTSRRWKDGKQNGFEQFATENPMLDPITATFLARTLPIESGKQVSFDVYNGKHRFLIKLDIGEREKISVNGVEREAFRVVPTVRKLTDPSGDRKLKSAIIWVSADDERQILKIESKVWVGSVAVKLRSYTGEQIQSVRAQLALPSATEQPTPLPASATKDR